MQKRDSGKGILCPPVFFVLLMEYLYRSLKKLKHAPYFNYDPRCEKMKPTHVYFLDDLIMCFIADKSSIQLMMKAFENFSSVSGLQDNLDKSSFYVAGVPNFFIDLIQQDMKFTLEELPFKYLGVPLSTRKLNIQKLLPLVEKIISNIKCWTSNLLSYSGRLQLIKSVLIERQTYWAQVFLLSKKVIKIVTNICRVFL